MIIHDGDTQPLTPIEPDPSIARRQRIELIKYNLHRTLQSDLALCAALGVAAGMILRGWEYFLHSGTNFQAAIGALFVGFWLWFFFSPDPGN